MWGGQSFLAISLRWLAPLLVLGLTLLLSLRLSLPRAAALVYAGWLVTLALLWETGGDTVPSLSMLAELTVSMAGLALLVLYVRRRPTLPAGAV